MAAPLAVLAAAAAVGPAAALGLLFAFLLCLAVAGSRLGVDSREPFDSRAESFRVTARRRAA